MIGVMFLWFVYPTLVQYLVGLIRCRRLDDGVHVYLRADMSITCYDSAHSAWYGLTDIARHVIGCGLTHETRVRNALNLDGVLGPDRYCLPRRRTSIQLKRRRFEMRWMTWRALSVRSYGVAVCVLPLQRDVHRGNTAGLARPARQRRRSLTDDACHVM